MIFLAGDVQVDFTEWFNNESNHTTFEQIQEKTRQIQLNDIVKSIKKERDRIRANPELEPFTLQDIMRGAEKNRIFLPFEDLRNLRSEALNRCLDDNDYRKIEVKTKKEVFKDSWENHSISF